jgi:hypothetical protein
VRDNAPGGVFERPISRLPSEECSNLTTAKELAELPIVRVFVTPSASDSRWMNSRLVCEAESDRSRLTDVLLRWPLTLGNLVK